MCVPRKGLREDEEDKEEDDEEEKKRGVMWHHLIRVPIRVPSRVD